MAKPILVILMIMAATSCTLELLIGFFMVEQTSNKNYMNKYHTLVVPEKVFQSYAGNRDGPRNLTMGGSNNFNDFSNRLIKLDNLFKRIYLESSTLFEDVTSVKIEPYCIPAEAFTNNEICFRNTKIYNLENMKLSGIELGRSTIHKKKVKRFFYATHKFDELLIIGTTDFVEIDSQDTYRTTINNSKLLTHRDYEKLGYFSIEIPFLEGYSEANTDKYVAHAVDMHLKRAHDMHFHLPVDGFNGLLELLENEINIPSKFFPENITFNCSEFPDNDVTLTKSMSINTKDMRLNEQLNYDVFNSVKFVDLGDAYQTEFEIIFNELAFTTFMSVKLNGILVLNEEVLVEIDRFRLKIVYYPLHIPMYKITAFIEEGVSLFAEKNIDPYFYTQHFIGKLSNCIKATTVYNLDSTLHFLKAPQLQLNPKTNYTTCI